MTPPKPWILVLALIGLVMSGHGCVGQRQRHRTALAMHPAGKLAIGSTIAALALAALPVPTVFAEGGKGSGKPKDDGSASRAESDDDSSSDDDRKPAARPVPDPMAHHHAVEERSLVVSGTAAAQDGHHQAYARAATPAARRGANHRPPAEAGDSPSTIEIDLADHDGFDAQGPNHFGFNSTSGRDRARAAPPRNNDTHPHAFPMSPSENVNREFQSTIRTNRGAEVATNTAAINAVVDIARGALASSRENLEAAGRANEAAMEMR